MDRIPRSPNRTRKQVSGHEVEEKVSANRNNGDKIGMKTLNQFIENKELAVGHYNLDSEEIIECVREWLQQKRENAMDRYASGEAYFYTELLDELEL